MRHEEFGRFRNHLRTEVDGRRVDAVWRRLEERRGSRGVPGTWALAALGAFAAVLLFWGMRLTERSRALALQGGAPAPRAIEAAGGGELSLDDGSKIVLSPDTHLSLVENTGKRFALELGHGGALFDVVPHGPRVWSIQAAWVTVEVLGTRFRVDRGRHSVRVAVERGRVRVRSGGVVGGGSRELTEGATIDVEETTVLSGLDAGSQTATTQSPENASPPFKEPAPFKEPPLEPHRTEPNSPPPKAATSNDTWRSLAAEQRYGDAYSSLGAEGLTRATAEQKVSVSDLLALADVARLSRHPQEAVAPLERVTRDFPEAPQAGVAAFTLGRIRLDDLADARGAAAAFERALALSLPEALKEDATARRVEAYSRAGQPTAARAARREYAQLYPRGRYAERVATWAPN